MDINDSSLVLGLTKRRPNVNVYLHTPPRPRESMSALKQKSPRFQDKENAFVQQKVAPRKTPSARGLARKPSALGDRTMQIRNAENSLAGALDKSVSETDKSKGSVRDRMREWELERARLREMERVGESDTQDVEQETERRLPVRKPSRLGDILSPELPSPGTFFFHFYARPGCMVTVIPTDAHSSPIRPSDPFARTISAKLFKPVKDSTAPPTSMTPMPRMYMTFALSACDLHICQLIRTYRCANGRRKARLRMSRVSASLSRA